MACLTGRLWFSKFALILQETSQSMLHGSVSLAQLPFSTVAMQNLTRMRQRLQHGTSVIMSHAQTATLL
jgi:hypothetical protein